MSTEMNNEQFRQATMSEFNTPKVGGVIRYVSAMYGADTNDGLTPMYAFATIGAANSASAAGDVVSVMAGNYNEQIDVTLDNMELWFESGAVIQPASGTGAVLTLSGDFIRVKGDHAIMAVGMPAVGMTPMLVSGDYCSVSDGRMIGGEKGITVTGSGVTIQDYAVGMPSMVGYDIQGSQCRIRRSTTVGTGLSIGYKISNGATTGVIDNCTSAGHQISGFFIDTGSSKWIVKDCVSGAGDGPSHDVDHLSVMDIKFDSKIVHHVDLNTDGIAESWDTGAGVEAMTVYNCFKVTGSVRVTRITAIIETEFVGVTSNRVASIGFRVASYNSSGAFQDQEDITEFSRNINNGIGLVGSILEKNAASSGPIDFISSHGPNVDAAGTERYYGFLCVADADAASNDTYIQFGHLADAGATGVLHVTVEYEPVGCGSVLAKV